MYRIKQSPEDFIVKEITSIKIQDKGDYIYFLLKKKNYNTLSAIERIADSLHLPLNRFGFAGNKDKHAITEQLVSVTSINRDNLEKLSLKDIEIKILGYGEKYISLGDLKGNKFTITVKNLNKEEMDHFSKISENKPIQMPNLFGEQRFSTQNTDIGRAIIKREFNKAAELLKLDIIDNDYIGAIRKVNKKILRLYVHAYQSYIFNLTISEYLKNTIKKNKKIPIVGFGTELERYDEKIAYIIGNILTQENINIREFITLKIPELSEEGSERDLFVEIEDLKTLEKGKDSIKIGFFLQKGSYATEAIEYLFKP